ncbi:MAG: 1-deoxy-D-xylulose-5-phosphate reductoisomerase [Bacilli bacterium]|nr:1-deoxy-D-xylulose-5-phosphate reductoisomerase [Bacilli bacterium]
MISLTILGVSGSIGQQSVKVIKDNIQEFSLIGVSVNTNGEYLNQLLEEFKTIKYVCIGVKMDLNYYKNKYKKIMFFQGDEGLKELCKIKENDLIVNALVGFVGLRPTIEAIKNGIDLALANKESLVVAGDLINKLLVENDVEIFPIDSEHSAIYQCLKGEHYQEVRRLVITSSGGAFRDKTLEELENVTVEEALKHPNWKMGSKITIDCATMVNKGLEVIEAHHLFNFDYNKIDVVMHLESVVHSMVEFNDGGFKAQIGMPNMEIPILFALSKGHHLPKYDANLMLNKPFSLNFRPIDFKKYEALLLAYEVGKLGGSYPIVYNAANEVAVEEFLNRKISFLSIVKVIKECIKIHEKVNIFSLEDIIKVDKSTRILAYKICNNIMGGRV